MCAFEVILQLTRCIINYLLTYLIPCISNSWRRNRLNVIKHLSLSLLLSLSDHRLIRTRTAKQNMAYRTVKAIVLLTDWLHTPVHLGDR